MAISHERGKLSLYVFDNILKDLDAIAVPLREQAAAQRRSGTPPGRGTAASVLIERVWSVAKELGVETARPGAVEEMIAADEYELWMLRASRAVSATDKRLWAGQLCSLAAMWQNAGGKMEESLYAYLDAISAKDREQSGSAEDRPDVRKIANRRTPKAR